MSLYLQYAEGKLGVFHRFWRGALLVNLESSSSANNGLRLSIFSDIIRSELFSCPLLRGPLKATIVAPEIATASLR